MKMPDVNRVSPIVRTVGAGMTRATSSALQDIVTQAEFGDKEQLQVLLAVLSGLIGAAAAVISKLNGEAPDDPTEPSRLVIQWLTEMIDTGDKPKSSVHH